MSVIRPPVLADPVWERQPGETARQYQGFRDYRDLGPTRTLWRVTEMLGLKGSPRNGHKESASMGHWSAKWRWVERAEAFDSWLQHIVESETESAVRIAASGWEGRAAKLRDDEWAIASALTSKLRNFLDRPTDRVTETVREADDEGGTTIHITTIEPVWLDSRDIAGILRETSRLARLTVGLPTEGARALPPDPTGGDTSDVDRFLDNLKNKAPDIGKDVPG